jgi:N,N'-diacetyllegionaminate synthase
VTSLRLIAEIGVNHDGDLDRAVAMTRAAAAAGFDAVKFQYWNIDELLADEAPTAGYQGEGDQHALLASLRLDMAQLGLLEAEAHGAALAFIVTPDGERACRELLALHLDALKIGSGDADNPWLLDAALASGKPLIVSTGMMADDEVRRLVQRLAGAPDVTLLHCVSAYPTQLDDNGLSRMSRLAELSSRPVGFSDHTIGIAAAAAAVGMGAVVVEKHVTWSTTAPGPDHAMSLPLDDAAAWVKSLRQLAIGLHRVGVSADEAANRTVVRKGLYLRRNIAAGTKLDKTDLVALRPLNDGVTAGDRDVVAGRRAARDLGAGALLHWADLVT